VCILFNSTTIRSVVALSLSGRIAYLCVRALVCFVAFQAINPKQRRNAKNALKIITRRRCLSFTAEKKKRKEKKRVE